MTSLCPAKFDTVRFSQLQELGTTSNIAREEQAEKCVESSLSQPYVLPDCAAIW